MARITVEDCLEKVDNQYDLVLLAKERTTQLNSGLPMLVEENNDRFHSYFILHRKREVTVSALLILDTLYPVICYLSNIKLLSA